jgi:hypothetical protein
MMKLLMSSRRVFVEVALAGVATSALVPDVATQTPIGRQTQPRRRILVFDVNETLLDINALVPLSTSLNRGRSL